MGGDLTEEREREGEDGESECFDEVERSARCAVFLSSLSVLSPLVSLYLDRRVAVGQVGGDAGDVGNVVQGELEGTGESGGK
jgi:hypothetical protein